MRVNPFKRKPTNDVGIASASTENSLQSSLLSPAANSMRHEVNVDIPHQPVGPGADGTWTQVGDAGSNGLKVFEKQTSSGTAILNEQGGTVILTKPDGSTTLVNNSAQHSESPGAHVAYAAPVDSQAHTNPSSMPTSDLRSVKVEVSPYGSNENDQGLSAGQNSLSSPDVQDARAQAHPAAYSGGAAIEKVDYLKNGATLTTTATGAEIETTAAGDYIKVKPGSHLSSPSQNENDQGLSAGQNALSSPDVQDARANVHPAAYTGGAAPERVDYLKNGATLTTTATGAEIETTAQGNSYTVKAGTSLHPSSAPELVSEHGGGLSANNEPAFVPNPTNISHDYDVGGTMVKLPITLPPTSLDNSPPTGITTIDPTVPTESMIKRADERHFGAQL